jgi:hypothetical protein
MAYFPNHSSGQVLEVQCDRCPLGNGPCPVLEVQLIYNYDQLKEGQDHGVKLTTESKDRILQKLNDAIVDEIAALKNQPVRG